MIKNKDKVKESDSMCSLDPIVKSKTSNFFLLHGIWIRENLDIVGFLIRLNTCTVAFFPAKGILFMMPQFPRVSLTNFQPTKFPS